LIRPEEFESKYIHYKRLCFLAGHVRPRFDKNELENSTLDTSNEANSSLVGVMAPNPDLPSNQPHKVESTLQEPHQPLKSTENIFQLPPPPPKIKRVRREDEADCKDDDFYFLLSLHPYMGGMTLQQKLRLRMKFQKLVFKELFKDGDEADEIEDGNE
jgi:BESS motif